MTVDFGPDIVGHLTAKLSPSHVKSRDQGNGKVQYIEGWHAIAEANRIFGFGSWDRETIYCREVCRYDVTIGQYKVPGFKVGYEAKVCVTVEGVKREGTGHGSGIAKDLFDAIESAAKEAETDAMKRAFMTFGNPFGLALYDKTRENVGDDAPAPPQTKPAPKTGADTPFDADPAPPPVSDAMIRAIRGKADRPALEAWYKSNKDTIEALDNDDRIKIKAALAKAGERFPKRAA